MRKDRVDYAAHLVCRRLCAPLGSPERRTVLRQLRQALATLSPEEHTLAVQAGERLAEAERARQMAEEDDREAIAPGDERYYRTPGQGGPG